jgi:hypothetical protein
VSSVRTKLSWILKRCIVLDVSVAKKYRVSKASCRYSTIGELSQDGINKKNTAFDDASAPILLSGF